MEHLSLEIYDREGNGSQYASLPENASITITDTSEIFGSGDIWSHEFTLNVFANPGIFGSAGDLHGGRLHELLNKRRARLWVEGTPLFSGYIRLDDEVDVDEDGNVDISLESGQKTFDNMIEGAKANQVPMMDDVMIGMALWRKRKGKIYVNMKAEEVLENGDTFTGTVNDGKSIKIEFDGDNNPVQEYPRMVFPVGTFKNRVTGSNETINCINTDIPYDERHPYCNIALCYQRSHYENPISSGDDSNEPEMKRDVELMTANRLNSAPNFYVIYWIRCLMQYLGIRIKENQMLDVEDLRRLFFVNTNCVYKMPDAPEGKEKFTREDCRYQFQDARLIPEQFVPLKIYEGVAFYYGPVNVVDPAESEFEAKNKREETITMTWPPDGQGYAQYMPPQKAFGVKITSFSPMTLGSVNDYKNDNRYLHEAYASSECFPNVDVSEVISAIESGFGVRLLFDRDYKNVRIILLRNVFRNKEAHTVKCEIVEDGGKQENSIRGFRMTYGDSDDTQFYYKGFADALPHKGERWPDNSDTHDYSHWSLDEPEYAPLLNKTSAFNKTCYVTPNTGNAYGVKVDEEGKRYDELHPELFEFAGFMDAEDGDCSGEDETIHTVSVNFAPLIMNDVNARAERYYGVTKQKFALFVDEKMMPRRHNYFNRNDRNMFNHPALEYNVNSGLYMVYNLISSASVIMPGAFAIASDTPADAQGLEVAFEEDVTNLAMFGSEEFRYIRKYTCDITGHLNEGYRLYLQDNFEPNDDGVSPIETHEWGLTLGIMRGSGDDGGIEYSADSEDEEGNDTWEIKPGSSVTSHPDTCDNYGNLWDYNGSQPGTGGGGSVTNYTGYQYGDKLMRDFGLQNQCDLKTRKGHSRAGDGANIRTYGDDLLILTDDGYYYAMECSIEDQSGTEHKVWLCCVSGGGLQVKWTMEAHIDALQNGTGETPSSPAGVDEILSRDLTWGSSQAMIIAVDPKWNTDVLGTICRYYMKGDEIVRTPADDRVSLKLRAEKPNPFFDPKQPEGPDNRRLLEITDPRLRGRGLADQFYKEFSYWMRNARIAPKEVRMEMAELLSIDKTVKQTVGDVTGFIRKMQYTISNKTGLGTVKMEIMYI